MVNDMKQSAVKIAWNAAKIVISKWRPNLGHLQNTFPCHEKNPICYSYCQMEIIFLVWTLMKNFLLNDYWHRTHRDDFHINNFNIHWVSAISCSSSRSMCPVLHWCLNKISITNLSGHLCFSLSIRRWRYHSKKDWVHNVSHDQSVWQNLSNHHVFKVESARRSPNSSSAKQLYGARTIDWVVPACPRVDLRIPWSPLESVKAVLFLKPN